MDIIARSVFVKNRFFEVPSVRAGVRPGTKRPNGGPFRQITENARFGENLFETLRQIISGDFSSSKGVDEKSVSFPDAILPIYD